MHIPFFSDSGVFLLITVQLTVAEVKLLQCTPTEQVARDLCHILSASEILVGVGELVCPTFLSIYIF